MTSSDVDAKEIELWLKEYDKYWAGSKGLEDRDFKTYEDNFLRFEYPRFSREANRMEKSEQKDRERVRSCVVLTDLLTEIYEQVQILDYSGVKILELIAYYCSMESLAIKVLKAYVSENDSRRNDKANDLLKKAIKRVTDNLDWMINSTHQKKQ